MAYDLDEWHPSPVVVNQRVTGLVDAPSPANVDGLAGVLFQMGPLDSNPLP